MIFSFPKKLGNLWQNDPFSLIYFSFLQNSAQIKKVLLTHASLILPRDTQPICNIQCSSGWMTERSKRKLHSVPAIFSYCPSGLKGSFIRPLIYVVYNFNLVTSPHMKRLGFSQCFFYNSLMQPGWRASLGRFRLNWLIYFKKL